MVLRWRHPFVRIVVLDAADQFRGGRIAGNNNLLAGLAFPEGLLAVNEGDLAGLLHPAVADRAVLVEQRPDVAVEVDRLCRRGDSEKDRGEGKEEAAHR